MPFQDFFFFKPTERTKKCPQFNLYTMQIKPYFLYEWAYIQVARYPLSVTEASLPWQPYTVFQKYYLHFNQNGN